MDMNCTMPMPMNCSMGMGPMKMQMYFYFGVHDVTILFEGWDVNSVAAMVGSFFAVFVFALLYEGLKVFREVIHRRKAKFTANRSISTVHYQKISATADMTNTSHYGTTEKAFNSFPVAVSLGVHTAQTFLHMLQVTLSYFLMLIAMTYNVWLFIAIILGAGAGYFLFARFRGPGTRSQQDENEHCH